MKNKYGKIKYACYTANISMSVVANISPLLFLTFRNMYGISFSMLGALVFINFCIQLFVDLIFSFYSHRFNIKIAVKMTPVLTAAGLFVYAIFPVIFPEAAYAGILAGTVIFAAAGGFAEVLISPIIDAVTTENHEREMSKLHSVYAWGVVAVVFISTGFLMIFGRESWPVLALVWMTVPIVSAILFFSSEMPELKTPEKASNVLSLIKRGDFLLFFICIFLGGASECTMSQWSSSYLEFALGIPKFWGDVLGVAFFAFMLGLGRTLYSKFGKNVYKTLIISAIGASLCYITAAVSNIAAIGLAACALTGLCTAVMWPGTVIAAAERFPASGVAVFALMAAGGDLGGATGTQILGSITDFVTENGFFTSLAGNLGSEPGQFGMKAGLLCAAVFPLLAIIFYSVVYRRRKKLIPPTEKTPLKGISA